VPYVVFFWRQNWIRLEYIHSYIYTGIYRHGCWTFPDGFSAPTGTTTTFFVACDALGRVILGDERRCCSSMFVTKID
jgi:hypothetical protein